MLGDILEGYRQDLAKIKSNICTLASTVMADIHHEKTIVT
jgi:hypothetical protein